MPVTSEPVRPGTVLSRGAAAISEFATTPAAIIVHDPVDAGAIRRLVEDPDPQTLQERYLFRQAPDPDLFARQHRDFVEVIGQNVDQVHYLGDLLATDPALRQAAVNPNQVYTRDALVTLPWVPGAYLPGRMAAAIRRPEEETMRAALEALDLHALAELPEGLILEGGDVIPFSREGCRTLLIGYARRTQAPTLDHLAETLIPDWIDEIIGVELASWRINLDGGLVPVADDTIIAHPDSVLSATLLTKTDRQSIDLFGLFRDLGMRVVEVTREESLYRQACNCLCLGNRRIICYDMTPHAVDALRAADIDVITVPGSELVKGTGGPRCMSRPLYA